MATITQTEKPLWTEDGFTYYHSAFAYHKPWVVTPPYQTPLTVPDESAFTSWVSTWDVPFDTTASVVGYDMRGYWIARVKGTSVGYTVGERPPDLWLTPYSTMFSVHSLYARKGCPYHWQGDKLFDESNGLMLFWAGYKPPSNKAIDYVERSKLDPRAVKKGLMGDDLDMQNFRLYVSGKLRLKADDQITDAVVTRTIDGASYIDIVLDDADRDVLRSGLLAKKLDFELDGLQWRLTKVGKDESDELTLTFETKEIAVLRLNNRFISMKRDDTHTRAKFILRMIREAGGMPNIPVVIPDINLLQPIEGTSNPDGTPTQSPAPPGITTDPDAIPDINDLLPIPILPKDPRKNLTVKGTKATPEQITNANFILNEGMRLNLGRKLLVCSIMTAIVESRIINNPGGDDAHGGGEWDSAGLFQQTGDWGTYKERTTPTSAAYFFFKAAIIEDRRNPSEQYWELCANVQHPKESLRTAYALWKGEAENWVTAYGIAVEKPIPADTIPIPIVPGLNPATGGVPAPNQRADTSGATGDNTSFLYYRGVPGTGDKDSWGLEDSWTCIQRLAGEVNWRAFFVGGTFWYVNDTQLFRMKPIMTLTESSAGIDSISFDYDNNKKTATVTIRARVGRWIAQPGAVVVLKDMGPVNGKWIVNEFTRSLFDLTATIILKKPLPELPEAATNITTGETPAPAPKPGVPPIVITPPPSTAPCLEIAQSVYSNAYLDGQPANGRTIKVYHANDMADISQAAQGLPCTDGTVMDCDVWRVMLWLAENYGPISTYAIHSGHGPDGLGGHSTGHAFDLNSAFGHDFGSEDPTGEFILATANALRAASSPIRPLGMIITGWQQNFHSAAADLCIPEGSYYGTGPTGFNWDVTPTSHANHIHICYTPGIPAP